MDKRRAIIIDIDGTLANIEHRRSFLNEDPPDWLSFSESMIMDTHHEWCLKLAEAMWSKDYEIVLVSGRTEEFRQATLDWLENIDLPFRHKDLYMRPNKDYRSDDIIKEEIYKKDIEPYYDILFVVDDRTRVVKKWRELGLTCLQCAEGNY